MQQGFSQLYRRCGNSAFRLLVLQQKCQYATTTRVANVVKRVGSSSSKESFSSPSETSTSGSSKAAFPNNSPLSTSTSPTSNNNNNNGGDGSDHDLSGSLFNPDEGYLQNSQWSTSFQGMAAEPFDPRISEMLMAPVTESDIEIKPDGLLYLPEIKYRRILNRAFGPGGWGLVPRGAHSVSGRTLSREYALVCLGRFISQARGEQDFFDEGGLATATEGCKSNALVRCCKDLGIASELWDPAYVAQFKEKYCVDEWVTHAVKGSKKRMWRLKTRKWDYPWSKK